MRFAELAFPTAVRQTFTYHIPESLALEPGVRAWVPLRGVHAIGMVVKIHDTAPSFKTQPVIKALDVDPVVSQDTLRLVEWISTFYFCSQGEVLQTALPSAVGIVAEERLVQVPVKDAPLGVDSLSVAEKTLLDDVDSKGKEGWSLAGLKRKYRGREEVKAIASLKKKGWVQVIQIPKTKVRSMDEPIQNGEHPNPLSTGDVHKTGDAHQIETPIHPLTPSQDQAFEPIQKALQKGHYQSFLLHGVTGSGKTEVYLHAIDQALATGKGAIVLVPEIALTPQTVARFERHFGPRLAVLHSRQTDKEKAGAWHSIQSGDAKVVVGPRSAIFAPVDHLGVIVVDEEHDTSYKQFDPAPRYHARDVALMRASIEQAVCVLGSATPSITTWEGAQQGKHTLLSLTERPFGSMPKVSILPMQSYRSAMKGPLTVELYSAIEESLERQEQSIILLNRRGSASYIQCSSCGHIPECPQCSVSMTYHKLKNMLLCHYSGHAHRVPTQCESCGSQDLEPKGMGTQQLEEELQTLYPDAVIRRMDRDSTSKKDDHAAIYQSVKQGEADILLGTQMLAKGLDFPNVTVVGVLQAENELAFPSWRASERLYQLISQVAGRAGRAERPGHVYVQTYLAEHEAFKAAENHDYMRFVSHERAVRQASMYPPFCRMVTFHLKGRQATTTIEKAQALGQALRQHAGESNVLGPAPALIERIQNRTHWQVSLKVDPQSKASQLYPFLDRIIQQVEGIKKQGWSSVRLNVDVDAVD
ncbi:MAG: primosomal protein N' [Balneolaceae bacterium]|nr:primosomal protein N' [Balneolaceae bacterium]